MADGGKSAAYGRLPRRVPRLRREPDQIFESAAATRHDDHIHIWIGIQLPDGRYHVRRALLALHMHMRHFEADNGPTQTHVGDDIAFGASLRRANQTMQCGNSGNGFLRSASEQAFAAFSFLRNSSIMAFRLPPAPAAIMASP